MARKVLRGLGVLTEIQDQEGRGDQQERRDKPDLKDQGVLMDRSGIQVDLVTRGHQDQQDSLVSSVSQDLMAAQDLRDHQAPQDQLVTEDRKVSRVLLVYREGTV